MFFLSLSLSLNSLYSITRLAERDGWVAGWVGVHVLAMKKRKKERKKDRKRWVFTYV